MLRPGHVSQGGLRRGRGEQIAGKPGFDVPSAPVASPPLHPTEKRPEPAATPRDPQAPPPGRARCHVTTPPLKHRRNAGRRKAFAPACPGPAPPGAGESRESGRGGGGRAWRRARARHKGFRARRRSARTGGGTIFGARGRSRERRGLRGAHRAHSRPPRSPDGRRPPRPAQARAASLPRAGPAPGPPAPCSRSLALARPPSWIGASSPRAAAAAFPLFPAPRRRRRRPHSPQLPIRAPPAVDLVSPQKSPVCYSRCGGVVTGWSPGVRERGPRLQRSCNPNPPSGGIFHTPMAPLQTWVRTALCWPRCLLPR